MLEKWLQEYRQISILLPIILPHTNISGSEKVAGRSTMTPHLTAVPGQTLPQQLIRLISRMLLWVWRLEPGRQKQAQPLPPSTTLIFHQQLHQHLLLLMIGRREASAARSGITGTARKQVLQTISLRYHLPPGVDIMA